MADSNLFNQGFETGADLASDVECTASTEAGASEDCAQSTEATVEFDPNIDDDASALVELLETRIFTESNIESETSTSVTYLLRGDVVCAGAEGQPPEPDCVTQVDNTEIRLDVTSPAEGDVDVALQVGPDRDNPFSFEFHTSSIAIEVDLGGFKGVANHLAAVAGEDAPELPAIMTGRVRAHLVENHAQSITAALSIVQAIQIAVGEVSFEAAQALPMLELTADATSETLDALVNVGAIDTVVPSTQFGVDSMGNETETTHSYAFHLGGLTSQTLFDAVSESVEISNIGLGTDTTTLNIDGVQVLAVDLNENYDRSYSATIRETSTETEFTVDPAFDLRVALQFVNAADALGDVADWMLDDVFRITLDGASAPRFLVRDDGSLEVVDGTLTLSQQNAGITHAIDAGMCLLPTTQDGDNVESTDMSSENPLDAIEAGVCE